MTVKHLYPNSTPALILNPKSSRVADPRLSCVRASAATYVDPVSGLVKTVQDNVARVDKDGLMVEESRTNSFEYSEDFSQTTHWDPVNSIVTFHATEVAPDGSTGVYATQPNATSGYQWLTVENSPVHTNPSCISVFAKANGYDYFFIHMSTDDAAVFNLSTGTVESTLSGNFSSIEDFGNGWYRCSVVHNTAHSGQNWGIGCRPNATHSAFTSNGSSVFIWGAQWEDNKTFPTSYIPTSGSTYQRLADEITLTNSGIFNPNQNTIINTDFGIAGGSDTLTIVGDGTKAKRTAVYNSWLTQAQTAALTGTDDWWKWRILGSTFGLNNFTTDGQVSVDWGDGTTVETLTTSDHTFTNGSGYHTIKFRLDSGTYFKPAISANTTHMNKVISVGPVPESMGVRYPNAFRKCQQLKTFDGAGSSSTDNSYSMAWNRCSSLLSFPYIDTTNATSFYYAWNACSGLTKFPLLKSSNVTNFSVAWSGCSGISGPFPEFDTSAATNVGRAWSSCPNLTTFPLIDTSGCTGTFTDTWISCTTLGPSFPAIECNGSSYNECWRNCYNLSDFPANMFDAGTVNEGKGHGSSFNGAWRSCALTAQSIENILVSLDTSGVQNSQAGLQGGSNAAKTTWTTAANNAYDNLVNNKGWTIDHNP